MKVLITGGTGLLGHKLYQVCKGAGLSVQVTVRGVKSTPGWFDPQDVLGGVDVTQVGRVERAIRDARPSVVVNCVGIVPSLVASEGPAKTIHINTLFPHQLRDLCLAYGSRLIHISTDCVFSGWKHTNEYTEDSTTMPVGVYGQSKLLGEAGSVILRTSFVGPEIGSAKGLFGWFLSQTDSVRGYYDHFFTGLTTLELSRAIILVLNHPELYGLYHVGGPSISKYYLLRMIKAAVGSNVVIRRDWQSFCDRRLDSSKFEGMTGYTSPPWADMVTAMVEDWKRCSYKTNES